MAMPRHYATGDTVTIRRLDSDGARRPSTDTLGYSDNGASGWLASVVRWDRASRRFLLLTGQHPTQATAWRAVATRTGRPVPFEGTPHQAQRAALAVSFLSLAAGHGAPLTGEYDVRFGATTCDRCPRPLASNVMPRKVPDDAAEREWRGQTVRVGPECWERITGQRERRKATKAAAVEIAFARVMGHATPTAPARCAGTCNVDTHCDDCDGPR